MEALVRRRSNAKAQTTRVQTALDTWQTDKVTPTLPDIEVRLDVLNQAWEDFNTIQESIEDACSADVQQSAKQPDERAEFETKYLTLKARLLNLRASQEPKTPGLPPPPSQPVGTAPSSIHIPLPRLELQTFSGKCTEWASFSDLFIALVHNNSSLQAVQKFQYLKTCLGEEPKRLISSLQVNEANYARAWDLLRDNYSNKRQVSNSHYQAIISLKQLKSESGSELRSVLNTVLENKGALEVLKANTWEDFLIYLMTDKLDPQTRKHWEMSQTTNELPKFADFESFLRRRCQALEIIGPSRDDTRKKNFPTSSKAAHVATSRQGSCPVCQAPHMTYRCDKFLRMSVQERYNTANSLHLCYNCLSSSHPVTKCASSVSCLKCKKRHHTLLHNDSTASTTSAGLNPQAPAFNVLCNMADLQTILPTAIVSTSKEKKKWIRTRSFLDSGSQANFITEQLATALGLPRLPCDSKITGIGGDNTSFKTNGLVRLHIRSLRTGYGREITAVVLPRITTHLPQTPVSDTVSQRLSKLSLADTSFSKPAPVDLLLGVQVFAEILSGRRKTFGPDLPTALETRLGWIVAGDCKGRGNNEALNNHSYISMLCLEEQLQKFWSLDEVTTVTPHTEEEAMCQNHFLSTHSRDATGRYTVRLPLKNGGPDLGESRERAIVRFLQQERKMSKDPAYKEQYTSFMREYENLGHMRQIQSSDHGPSYFLPHHAVLKQASSTTKLRVVFDASSKTSSGVSLNDKLGVGPTIQADVPTILLRFRRHPVPMVADIEKMFRQICLHPEDQPLQRIIWREHPSLPLFEYQLTTVTYGTASAPYLAQRTLLQLATDEAQNYPKASLVLKTDFYVDDCVTGAPTLQEAIQLQEELIHLLRSGGFELRKWASTESKLLESHSDQSTSFFSSQETQIKTLGVLWNTQSDDLSFPDQHSTSEIQSKRDILSAIARIFDPLGLISPIVLPAKFLMQRLWLLKTGWDDPIPSEVRQQWVDIADSLRYLGTIKIPRFIGTVPEASIELHGFCDASEKGYGAVIYSLVQPPNGERIISLLCSKTRVAPLKTVSLPRLELCGALLLSRLMKTTRDSLSVPLTHCLYWTDSTVALAWIKGHPSRWRTFVANRVSEIHDTSSPKNWHHVRGEENPADLASRGSTATSLTESEIWWNGPPWLSKPLDFSLEDPQPEELPEKKVVSLPATVTPADNNLIKRYSSLQQLIRITAWILRFIDRCQRKPASQQLLSKQELDRALYKLIKVTQIDSFPDDRQSLENSQTVITSSKLASLSPFLDSDGILRVGGRLRNTDLCYDTRHPILLPAQHPLTTLIVRNEHIRHLHAYPSLLLTSLRRRYWILRGRDVARACVHRCVICFRQKAKTQEQIMADLPRARVTQPTRPFIHCGVDYAGPISLRLRSGRGRPIITKGYFALFICFATKAIHLELVSSLSSDAFLATFKRFVSRRGKPTDVYSDCGTNFVGAQQVLKPTDPVVSNFAANEGIRWHFNPPASPHFGGLWEAGVKSVKQHLHRVLGDALLTFEEMYTVLTQIEACLNSRPLCALSSNPNDLQALTPGHFLIGTSLTAIPEQDYTEQPEHVLKQWERLQQRVQHFWRRWSHEYLSTLQQRPKWTHARTNLQVGDLVLLKETSQHQQWQLGRILQVHPGADGHVRTATLRTATSTLKRPIVKLCLLPID